jgi:hypothetical protein
MASCFVFPVAREKWTSFTCTLFWDVGVYAFSFWHFHEFDLWVFLVAGLLQKDSAFLRIECVFSIQMGIIVGYNYNLFL